MKGHATIELTDVITGRKEIHEDDNLVTNALSWLLNKTCGVLHNNPMASAIGEEEDSFIKACTGGIFLFKEHIEEDVDTLYAPNDAELVGCGSGIAYSGNSPIPGSYNSIESGYSDDKSSYKHVWDFSTSQANGQISCVCLTTRAGGKITPGVPYYDETYTLQYEPMFLSGNGIFTIPYGKNNNNRSADTLVYSNGKEVYVYAGRSSRDGKEYDAYDVYSLNLTNRISMSDLCYEKKKENGYGLLDTFELEVPETYRTFSGYEAALNNGKYRYLVKSNAFGLNKVTPGTKIDIWKINIETKETEEIILTNTLDVTFESPSNMCGILENSIFLVSGNKIYRINIKDISDYTIMKNADETDFILKSGVCCIQYNRGKISFFDGGAYTNNGIEYIILPNSDIVFVRNRMLNRGYAIETSEGISLLGNSYQTNVYIDPTILVTINNLQSPVTKTASQAMKITYTLEFGDQ